MKQLLIPTLILGAFSLGVNAADGPVQTVVDDTITVTKDVGKGAVAATKKAGDATAKAFDGGVDTTKAFFDGDKDKKKPATQRKVRPRV